MIDKYGTRYVVRNENALGYFQRGQPWPSLMGVLAGDLLAGGPDWKNGPTFVGGSDVVRPATPADFDRFRVQVPPGARSPDDPR